MYFRENLHSRIFTGFKLFKKGLIKIKKKNLPMNFRRNIEKTFHEENVHKKSA